MPIAISASQVPRSIGFIRLAGCASGSTERLAGRVGVLVGDLREPHARAAPPRRRSPGRLLEAEEADHLAGRDVDHPDAAGRSSSRSVIGRPLKMAVSRTCDRPTKARLPTKSRPRVKPGISATVSSLPVSRSTTAELPLPDSSTQSRSAYQRGECGIDRPVSTVSPLVDVDQRCRRWPCSRASRPGSSVSPERGDVAGPVVDHAQAVQMAAVVG